ncbi:MAG TPA: hypothetical protein DEG26_08730 [Chloroflexi bacterium]|nr:hypothetical protein [Chloroflexota bacterium]
MSYSPCGSSIPETSVEPARLSVPVGVDGAVPVELALAASHETVDVFQFVGLMLATLVLTLLLLLLVEPQAAAPMAARPTTTHSR